MILLFPCFPGPTQLPAIDLNRVSLESGPQLFRSQYLYSVQQVGQAGNSDLLALEKPVPAETVGAKIVIFLWGGDQKSPFLKGPSSKKKKKNNDLSMTAATAVNWNQFVVVTPQDREPGKHAWKIPPPAWILDLAREIRRQYRPTALNLVGFSRGGWWATEYFLKEQQLFSGLVSIGGYPSVTYNDSHNENAVASSLHRHPFPSLWIIGSLDTETSIGSYKTFFRVLDEVNRVPGCMTQLVNVLNFTHQDLWKVLTGHCHERLFWEFMLSRQFPEGP